MLKVIAPLGDIPVGSTVTKIGGHKEYVVRDRLTVYDENGTQQTIYANDGSLYLTDGSGYINAYGFGKELVWHTSIEDLNHAHTETPQ